MRLYDEKAIALKKAYAEVELNKFSDPTEGELFDITIEKAEEISSDCQGLVYADDDDVLYYEKFLAFLRTLRTRAKENADQDKNQEGAKK